MFQKGQILAQEVVHGIKLELTKQQRMLTRMNKGDEMIIEKLDQILDKQDHSHFLIDILNDKVCDVKKRE